MADKVQGEGDYESARRYNRKTREFVESKRKHAKHGEQDRRDAQVFRKDQSKH